MKAPGRGVRQAALGCAALLIVEAAAWAQAGPPGGTVNEILSLPDAPGLLYAATDEGVFRSLDGGRTWDDRSAGLPFLPVTSLAGTERQLFAGVDGAGVFRSRDGGDWETAASGIEDQRVFGVANHPEQSRIVFAATADNGLFYSDNAGDGWIRPGGSPPEVGYLDIAISPEDSSRVLAASAEGGLIESVDGGDSWEVIVSGNASFRRIRFDPTVPGRIYVATSAGLLRRPEAGQPFAQVGGLGSESVDDVAVDPASPDALFVATRDLGILRSEDGGATWAEAGTGLPLAFVFALRTLPEEPTRLLAGLGGTGVFSSIDGGRTWRLSSTGLTAAEVLDLAIDPRDSQAVFASIEGGGLFRSSDGGQSWAQARNGLRHLRPSRLVIDPAAPDTLYVGSVDPLDAGNGALSRSDDRAESWSILFDGFPVFALAAHPSDARTLWVGSDPGFLGDQAPLLRSTDRGANLEEVFGDGSVLAGRNIRSIAVEPENPRNLYVISEAGGGYELLWSDNAGDSFRGAGAVNYPLYGVVIDPQRPERLYIPTARGIFRSNDQLGANLQFQSANSGLPEEGDLPIYSIAVAPDGSSRLLAATADGVYRSLNGGDSWELADEGLGQVFVTSIRLAPASGDVVAYAATQGSGVWISRDLGETWRPSGPPAMVNAAGFEAGGAAPEQLVSVFGFDFAEGSAAAESLPLPTRLGGVAARLTDSADVEREAPLVFVSPDQINLQIPAETALGAARLAVETASGAVREAEVRIEAAAPGLFTLPGGDGRGIAAANGLRENAAGERSPVEVYTVDRTTFEAVPIDLGPEGEAVFLELFGTGLRGAAAESLRVTVGGVEVPVLYAAPHSDFVGLDQVNIGLPRSLAGAGLTPVRVIANGRASNLAWIRIE